MDSLSYRLVTRPARFQIERSRLVRERPEARRLPLGAAEVLRQRVRDGNLGRTGRTGSARTNVQCRCSRARDHALWQGGDSGPKRESIATFHTRKDGYEYWSMKTSSVLVHRLVAVAEYGLMRSLAVSFITKIRFPGTIVLRISRYSPYMASTQNFMGSSRGGNVLLRDNNDSPL